MGPQEMLDRAEVKNKWKLTPLKNFKSPRLTERMWRTALVVLITSIIYEYPLEGRNPCFALIGAVYGVGSQFEEGFHNGINFSASHIISPTFVDECLNYRDSFTRRDLNLVLEVTEREPLNVDESLVQRLNILHENGFVIALDDFGTGYSGLSYLHDLHIDYIKIDHSFVGRVNADPASTRILDCVLDLARKLSISIVAEDVETKEQFDYLNQNNITFQQGYYFYKPVTYIDLVKIILSKPKVKVVVE